MKLGAGIDYFPPGVRPVVRRARDMGRFRSTRLGSGMGAMDGFIVTPGQIADEMKTVDGMIEAINRDVTRDLVATGKGTVLVNAWRAFRGEWKAWYEANKGISSRMWGGTADKVIDYRKRAADWQSKLKTDGGVTPSAPPIPKTSPLQSGFPSLNPFNWPTWAQLGLAVVGAAILLPYAKPLLKRAS